MEELSDNVAADTGVPELFQICSNVVSNFPVNKESITAFPRLVKKFPSLSKVVAAVPDSGIPAAIGYSKASGIPYGIAFIKNRYVGRTFITPSQELREKARILEKKISI